MPSSMAGRSNSAVESAETVIIGAGAAGLAAAAELAANGRSTLLLEARDRIGGRIMTDYTAAGPVPIELGAEFIHGESAVLLGWLERSSDAAIDVGGERWTAQRGALRRADSQLHELARIFGRLPPLERDVPFADFLQLHRRFIPPAIRQSAIRLVEGFDAADSTRISARSVIDEWSGPAAADAPTFRPARGYDALMQSIRHALPADRAALQLGTVVRSITWRRGKVSIDAKRHGEPVRVDAARAIVTLPLGVLQQLSAASLHSVRFSPELRVKRRPLAQLASGPVIKVVMNFSRPFWAELDAHRYRDASFFFAPQAVFPTFWTTLPLRTSQLVAWCAGPRVERLAGKSRDQVIATALESLRALFGRVDVSSLLEHAAFHDWQRDPFACGAYSYVLVGGARARRALAQPVEDTLFFAGEACDTDDSAATVGGALQSGVRAAREVLDST